VRGHHHDRVVVARSLRLLHVLISEPRASSSTISTALCQTNEHRSLPVIQIPLPPPAILAIWNSVRSYSFEDAYGAWPNRRLVGGARATVLEGVRKMISAEGHQPEAFVIEG
jgi:hypothetical protein